MWWCCRYDLLTGGTRMTRGEDGALDAQRAVSRETSTPEVVRSIFGDRTPMAQAYVDRLAGAGIERGLIGPREAPRLWERHVLNCAVVADLIGPGMRVADVGSGAGLPGIVLAIARPDLDIVLIEPLLRRSDFLRETIELLALDRVSVLRSRAEDVRVEVPFDVVTARAVASMEQLAGWTLPLLRPQGRLLALKGTSVRDELDAAAVSLARMGAASWTVEEVGAQFLSQPTLVAVVERGTDPTVRRKTGRRRR